MPHGDEGQATRTPSGLPYGERQQLEQAQDAVPLAEGGNRLQRAVEGMAEDAPAPVGVARPTRRPDEPVTAGLQRGAGPGPGVNTPPPVPEPDPAATRLAPYLPMLEAQASRPDASAGLKALFFRIKGGLPPDFTYQVRPTEEGPS